MNALSYAFSKSFSTVTKYSGVYVEEKKNNKDLHLLPLTKKKKYVFNRLHAPHFGKLLSL